MDLSKKQIEQLVLNYDIGNLISHRKAEKGVAHHNWLIKTEKGKFVFRVLSKFKKLQDILFEFRYMNCLNEKGFPYELPLPILSNNGKMISRFDVHYFWTYKLIDGNALPAWGKNELKQVAKMMASYHRIIEISKLNNRSKFGDSFHIDWILRELRKFKAEAIKRVRKEKKETIFLREVDDLIALANNLNGTGYSKLKKFPIHCDINPENVLFKNNPTCRLDRF